MLDAVFFPVLSINIDQMATVINGLPFAAHMRSLDSNHYILSNLQHAQQLGFESVKQIVHQSYDCIAQHRNDCIKKLGGDLALEREYQQFIVNANKKTELTKEPCLFQKGGLFPTGFIYIHSIRKIPILDSNEKAYAILTFSQDITSSIDLLDLYEKYRMHYNETKQAIQQFLKYLKLEEYFNILPTQQELMTLLMFKKDAKAKYAAKNLGLSNRTVEEYKSRLRNKLNNQITLEQLLLKLRHYF